MLFTVNAYIVTPGLAMIRTVCKYRSILITGITFDIFALVRFSSATP